MTPAGYARLARHLGAGAAGEAAAALAELARDPALAATLARHHLVALLGAILPGDELRACLPPAALAALGAELGRRRVAPREHLRTIAEAQAAFASDGLDCMVVKGVYFAHRLYGDLERRTQRDVDLVVRRRDFARACRTLGALGYGERWRDLHSVSWARDAAQIDLHFCFRNAPAYRLDEARIWAARVPYGVEDTVFWTPSDEDTLVLLALSLLQDVGLGAAKLKQLLDLHLLTARLDADFEWTGFLARRVPEGTLRVAVNVLDLALRVFDAAPALPRLAAALAPYRGLVTAAGGDEARALVFAARGAPANRAWFFAVYPGSLVRYWLWLLPRKLPTYLRGRAPRRGPSSLRPSLEAVRALVGARRAAARLRG